MIFFHNVNGDLVDLTSEKIYQGSHKANSIYLIAPICQCATVNVAFVLPNGKTTPLIPMTQVGGESPVIKDEFGNEYSVWLYELSGNITSHAGDVEVQFFIKQDTAILASYKSIFYVNPGVVAIPPEEPKELYWQDIITYIENITLKAATNSEQIADNSLAISNVEVAINNMPNDYYQKSDNVTIGSGIVSVKSSSETYKATLGDRYLTVEDTGSNKLTQVRNGKISTTLNYKNLLNSESYSINIPEKNGTFAITEDIKKLYEHNVTLMSTSNGSVNVSFISTSSTRATMDDVLKAFPKNKYVPCVKGFSFAIFGRNNDTNLYFDWAMPTIVPISDVTVMDDVIVELN
jgi:hypothetical protein